MDYLFLFTVAAFFYWLTSKLIELERYYTKRAVAFAKDHNTLTVRPESWGWNRKLIELEKMKQIFEELDNPLLTRKTLLIYQCKLDETAFELLVEWLKSNQYLKTLYLELTTSCKDIYFNQLQSLLGAFKFNKNLELFMLQSKFGNDRLIAFGKPYSSSKDDDLHQQQDQTINSESKELFNQIELALNPIEKKQTHFKYLFFQTRESEQRVSNVQFSFK